jgi:hypothetical protein
LRRAGTAPAPGFRVYAHSLRDRAKGIAVLALNTDRAEEQVLEVPAPSARYTLTARELKADSIMLNGQALQVSPDGTLPALAAESTPPGTLHLPPASITFLAIPAE